MSYTWNADHSGQRRECAVSDVLDNGMSLITAAVRWKVQVADLKRWVDDVRAAGPSRS